MSGGTRMLRVVNKMEMNGSFKRDFKIQFFGSWTSIEKLEILYLDHQLKKITNKKEKDLLSVRLFKKY